MRTESVTVKFKPRDGRGPNNRPLCRYCGNEVPKGKRAWCSRECLKAAYIQCYPERARSAVFDRDNGVCAKCGDHTMDYDKDRLTRNGSPWEMHHILPVAEGGETVMENLQTLCVRCHIGIRVKK